MKPAIQYLHPSGDQVWIDPKHVRAMQERYERQDYMTIIYTDIPDTVFIVKGQLREVLARFADK